MRVLNVDDRAEAEDGKYVTHSRGLFPRIGLNHPLIGTLNEHRGTKCGPLIHTSDVVCDPFGCVHVRYCPFRRYIRGVYCDFKIGLAEPLLNGNMNRGCHETTCLLALRYGRTCDGDVGFTLVEVNLG